MKKILLVGLIFGLCFAVNTNIRVGNTGGKVFNGYDSYWMEVKNAVAPTADMVWYADSIAGYNSVDFYFTGVSTGSVPTTISATPVYSDGVAVTGSQTITSGTDLTDLRSAYYKFTLPAIGVTRNVSFNFLIAK